MTVDPAAIARDIIDRNLYLTLATADAAGRPWATPVYFAPGADLRRFYWSSTTDARHSVHLARRPEVSFVVFDSTVAPYTGEAVYASGTSAVLAGDELDEGLASYPGRSGRGVGAVVRDDFAGPSPYRLYRVVAAEMSILCPRPRREPCELHGLTVDHRADVTL